MPSHALVARAARLAPTVLLAAWILAPTQALAQAGPGSGAAELLARGRTLQAQGKIDEACDAFAAAEKESPEGTTTLQLARCLERANRGPEAYRAYERLERMGRERSQIALQRAGEAGRAAVARSVALVEIHVAGSADGLRVRLDGREIDADERARPIAVAPSEVRIEATAPRRKPWSTRRTLRAGETTTVDVPALAEDVLQPVAADRSDARDVREVGGATWNAGVGFVVPGSASGPPADAAESLPAAPPMHHEPLHRVEVLFGGGYSVFGFDGREAEGMTTDVAVGYEGKKRFSPVAWWLDFNLDAAFLFDADTTVVSTGGRVGVDFRPTLPVAHLEWISIGPFLGFDTYFADVVDYGPELGYVRLALRTHEGAAAAPAVRLDLSLFDRVGADAAATYATARIVAGTSFRFGALGAYRLGVRGDDSLAVSRAAEVSLFLGYGS